MIQVTIPNDPEVVNELCHALAVFIIRSERRTALSSDQGATEEFLSLAGFLPLLQPVSTVELQFLKNEQRSLEERKREFTLRGETF